jgi:hypothetical protein
MNTKRSGVVNDPLNQCGANAMPPMLGSDENPSQPRRQVHTRVHVVLNQHSRTGQSAISERDDDCRYLAMAATPPKPRSARLDRIAWPQIRPLAVMPSCKSGNEVLVVCKVVDLHGRARAVNSWMSRRIVVSAFWMTLLH